MHPVQKMKYRIAGCLIVIVGTLGFVLGRASLAQQDMKKAFARLKSLGASEQSSAISMMSHQMMMDPRMETVAKEVCG